MKYKTVSILLFLLATLVIESQAQVFTESKTVSRSFKVSQNTKVDISNKYGKIHLVPWKKDSVRFEIRMNVQSSSPTKLDKTISSIDFDFTGTPYFVSAKTTFSNQRPGFINELINLAESLANGGNDVEINYMVMVPGYVELNIDNKYGDVYLNDTEAKLRLNLSNGNLKAHDLNAEAEISVSFGDAMINSVGEARLTLSYADVEIRDADRLDIDCKSSKVRIEGVNVLRVKSKRDKFTIKKINSIQGDAFFTDFWIDELFENANMDMKYGNFNLDFISQDFSFLKINSEWTDMQFFFETGSGYSFNMQHFDTKINYPENLATLTTECLDADKKQFELKGHIGNKEKTSDLRLRNRSGNVTIFHK
ncbi:MAG: hypothetical protein K9H64_06560 [Bacteroidales bacterium]|nr:hypothetical protein [Bacteroidales bacterium]